MLYGYFPFYSYSKERKAMESYKDEGEIFLEEKVETISAIGLKGEVSEINSQIDEEVINMAAMENENARRVNENINEDNKVSEGISIEDEEMAAGNEGVKEEAEKNQEESNITKIADSQKVADENAAEVKKMGKVYTLEELSDINFLKNTIYTVDSSTSMLPERFNAEKLLGMDLTIQKDSSVPQILIYHTHSQETFSDSIPNDTNTSIVGVGRYLAQLLAENYGYNVIHNTASYDMIGGKLDRNYAFTLAEADVSNILKNNPSIQVVIDIHRDGVNENTHFVSEVNGKNMAKIMFFNGLSYNNKVGDIAYLNNPYIEENLAFSLQMQLKALENYPDYVRKVYLKGYRYNLHLMPRAALIEVGGQTNTFEEAKNAMEPLAEILAEILEKK